MSGGRSSQHKGRRAEHELCLRLHHEGFDQVAVAPPGNFGTIPDLTGLKSIHVEVKRCERLQLPAWLHQAAEDSIKFGDGLPAVFHRSNRGRWIVSMYLPDWAALYRRGEEKNDGDGIQGNSRD